MAALLAGALNVEAAGLGKLTVYSAIGQPLSAEVALSASKDELTSLSARLASHSAFVEAGIDFAPVLAGVRFSVAKLADGAHVLRLSTDTPLNEPFLHFLVELNWATGRVVREYTFLLDPPELLRAAKPASVVTPVLPQQAPARVDKAVAPPRPAASIAPPATEAAKEYRVKQGDTLSKVARENRPEHVSLEQMLVALFNSNREAFDGENMNRLRAGKILRLPDAGQAAAIEPGAARKIVLSQGADFNAYRRRLAEVAATTAPAEERGAQQFASGKIESKLETPAPVVAKADKLEVSRTEAAKSAKSGKGPLEEELIAREKALQEASVRIAQLEKNLENLKQLVEIKSQAGVQMQQQAAPAAASPAAPVAQKPAAEVPPAVVPAAPVSAPAAAQPAPQAAMEKPEAVPPVKAQPEAAPAAAPAPAPVKKKPAPQPPPPPPPSFIEESPEIVFGGGGLIALLLGYLGYSAWRKKKAAAQAAAVGPEAFDELVAEASAVVAPIAATSEAQFENAEVSILGDFSESGVLTAEESVDPVAEADVLMAYGRDVQAEEILLEGMKVDPTRSAIYAKLLDLYAQRGDAASFEPIATELYALTGGEGDEWGRAVALAAGMGISHGVFAAAVAPESMDRQEPVPAVNAPDESIEAEPALEAEASPVVEPGVESLAYEVSAASAEPEVAVDAAPAAEPGGGLDFDLDLGTSSMSAAVEPLGDVADSAAAAQPADEVMSLDFDFDLGSVTPEERVAPADEASPAVPEDAGNAVDFALDAAVEVAPAGETAEVKPDAEAEPLAAGGLDFDLDLGSGVVEAAVQPGDGNEAIKALQLGDISLDLDGHEATGVAAVPADVPEIAGSEPELTLPDVASTEAAVDFDLGADFGAAVATPLADAADLELPEASLSPDSAGELTMSTDADADFDLDLGVPEAEETAVPVVESVEADDPEVATKLELAQAYEEMGDHEGARELLSEVLSEGSAAQRAAAQARLDQLLG